MPGHHMSKKRFRELTIGENDKMIHRTSAIISTGVDAIQNVCLPRWLQTTRQ